MDLDLLQRGFQFSRPIGPGRVTMNTDEQDRADPYGNSPLDTPEEFAETQGSASDPRGAPIPDLVRKAIELGFTGLFTTEQTIRRALGETVPQDWVDFVSSQSERTRADFTDALVKEVGRSLDNLDLAETLDQFLSGRTVELTTRIRILPRAETDSGSKETDV